VRGVGYQVDLFSYCLPHSPWKLSFLLLIKAARSPVITQEGVNFPCQFIKLFHLPGDHRGNETAQEQLKILARQIFSGSTVVYQDRDLYLLTNSLGFFRVFNFILILEECLARNGGGSKFSYR